MANGNDDRRPHDDEHLKQRERERNPFVAFRHFADDQLSSVFSSVSHPFSSFEDMQKQLDQVQQDFWSRFERAYERSTNPERRQLDDKPQPTAPKADDSPYENRRWFCRRRHGHQHHQDDQAALEEDQQPHRIRRVHHSFTLPRLFMLNAFDDDSQDFTLDFFALSPYSPLRLEQHPQVKDSGINWRHAFEDLISAETTPPRQRPDFRRDASLDRASGLEWAVELRNRAEHSRNWDRISPWQRFTMPWSPGLLNDWFPRERFLALSELEDHTEAEMYDRFLGQPSKKHGVQHRESGDDYDADNNEGQPLVAPKEDYWYCTHPARAQHEADTQSQAAKAEKPAVSILSTMTTTERRTLPDGSTTTRTILKRRFANGTEETQESSDSTPPVRTPPRTDKVEKKPLPSIAEQAKKKQDGAVGESIWSFWSK